MAIHSSSLACRIHGQRSLVDCSPWGGKQSEITKWLTHPTLLYLQYDLEIYPSYLSKRNGAFSHTKTCLQVFIEVLFIIVLTWTKSSIFQVVNELKKKKKVVDSQNAIYSAIKGTHYQKTMWANLKNTILHNNVIILLFSCWVMFNPLWPHEL